MNSSKMASLFDVDIETNLNDSESDASDYAMTASSIKEIRTFEQKCDDVKKIIPPESPMVSEHDKTGNKHIVESVLTSPSEVDEDIDIPGDIISAVNADIAGFAADLDKPEQINQSIDNSDNPLGLSPDDLKIFKRIQAEYPRFVLYNGISNFIDFYRYKFICLKTLLGRFSVLNFAEMNEELRTVKLDHYLDKDVIHPDIVRVKMNDAYRYRVRVAFLLIEAFEQFHVWQRWLEMMRSKLWKDHTQRGAYKNDGLAMEHLHDVEQYVYDMEGFIESAKHIDSMLKAASDSLSRQLTCLQLKDHYGQVAEPAADTKKPQHLVNKPHTRTECMTVDESDSIDHGTVISAPKTSGVLHPYDFGVTQTDEISQLGL